MYTPLAVANRFLRLSILNQVGCQKLTFLAYGHWFAKYRERLTNERPMAWENGPAFVSLYTLLSPAKNHQIHGPIYFADGSTEMVPDSDVRFAALENEVMSRYGAMTSRELVLHCMQEHGCWSRFISTTHPTHARNEAIPDKLILENFLLH